MWRHLCVVLCATALSLVCTAHARHSRPLQILQALTDDLPVAVSRHPPVIQQDVSLLQRDETQNDKQKAAQEQPKQQQQQQQQAAPGSDGFVMVVRNHNRLVKTKPAAPPSVDKEGGDEAGGAGGGGDKEEKEAKVSFGFDAEKEDKDERDAEHKVKKREEEEQKKEKKREEHQNGEEEDEEEGGEKGDGDKKNGDKKDGDKKDGDEKDADKKDGDEKDGDKKDGDKKDGDKKNVLETAGSALKKLGQLVEQAKSQAAKHPKQALSILREALKQITDTENTIEEADKEASGAAAKQLSQFKERAEELKKDTAKNADKLNDMVKTDKAIEKAEQALNKAKDDLKKATKPALADAKNKCKECALKLNQAKKDLKKLSQRDDLTKEEQKKVEEEESELKQVEKDEKATTEKVDDAIKKGGGQEEDAGDKGGDEDGDKGGDKGGDEDGKDGDGDKDDKDGDEGGGEAKEHWQKAVVRAHNKYRCQAKPSPKSMPAMEWDEALAKVAQRYADTCPGMEQGHNDKRTDWYKEAGGTGKFVGENMAWGMGDFPMAVEMWNAEYAAFDLKENTCKKGVAWPGRFGQLMKGRTISACGHYTQVVWAASTKVGCAVPKKECGGKWGKKIYVCNYAPAGNFNGRRPYEAGDGKDLAACKAAKN